MPRRPAKRATKASKPEKRVDETHHLTGKRRGSILREEVWYLGGEVVKYNLAYINSSICGKDNGRVLGYDNNHGSAHRHFMGATQPAVFKSFRTLLETFRAEVEELWRIEDEKANE